MSYHNGPLFKITSTCKGGGYHYCRTDPPHPNQNSNGLYPLHRVLMENKLERRLRDGEVVHHRNGNPTDDRAENLEVLGNDEHSRMHRQLEPEHCVCAQCGKEFQLQPHQARLRRKRTKSGKLFCSRSCGTSNAWREKRRAVEQSGRSTAS